MLWIGKERLTPQSCQVEMQQGADGVGLAADEVIVASGEDERVGCINTADKFVVVGNGGVHLCPDTIDAALHPTVGIVESSVKSVWVAR